MILRLLLGLLFISQGYATFRAEFSGLYLKANDSFNLGHSYDFDEDSVHELKLNSRWAPGMRGCVGFESSIVDIQVYYSSYETRRGQTWASCATPNPLVKGKEVGKILGEHTFLLPATVMSEVQGHTNIKIQEYGIDFAYPMQWSRLCLKPFVGIKGLSIDQSLFASFNHIYISTRRLYFANTIYHTYTKILGMGLAGGLYGEYLFGYGISAFCHLDGGAVYGVRRFLQQKDVTSTEDEIGEALTVGSHRRPEGATPFFDSLVGLLFQKPFSKCTPFVRVAFENHLYLNQNLITGDRGTLCTFGFSLTGGILF